MLTLPLNTATRNISPAQIDLNNTDFYVLSFEPLDPLIASIEQLGILHLPVVKETSDRGFIPVLGRRRLEAAATLKFGSFRVRVVDAAQPDDQTFIMAFWDNFERIKRDASVRACVVKRLMELIPRETLAKKIFPFMNVPAKGPKLERLRKIGGLERQLLEAMSNGRIQEKSAVILSELPGNQRCALMKLISDLGLNSNKAHEIISRLFDLSIHRQESITTLLARPEADKLLNSSNLRGPEKASQFRNLISRWAFPDLTENQRVFDHWVKQLCPPRNVTLKPAQSFEDESVTIEIRLNSRSEAKDFLDMARTFEPHGSRDSGY